MSQVPVRDQGEFGDCYSEVAVQLVDAYRFSHGDTRTNLQSSALMAAVGYARDRWLKFSDIYGGTACLVVDHMRTRGACNALALRTRFGREAETYMTRFTSWQTEVVASTSLEKKIRDYSYGLRGIPIHNPRPNLAQQYAGQICRDLSNAGFDATSLPSLAALEDVLKKDEPAALMDALRQGLCAGKNHFQVSAPECHEIMPFHPSNADIEKLINTRLDLPHSQPIGIEYCSAVLDQGKDYDGHTHNNSIGLGFNASDCGNHGSLVIGRRKNPQSGRCEYLVRNSWGTSCYSYSKDWSCEKGNVWIDAESLERNVSSVLYLQ